MGNPDSKMSHIQVSYELAPTSSLLGGLSWALLIHANYSAPSRCYFFPLSQTQHAPSWVILGFNPVISLVASRGSGYLEGSTCSHTGGDSNSVPLDEEAPTPNREMCCPAALRFQERSECQITQEYPPRCPCPDPFFRAPGFPRQGKLI